MRLVAPSHMPNDAGSSSEHFDWYVAQTRPNGEALALLNLERQSFNTFRPMIWEMKGAGPGGKRLMRPMFPGYVFIEFDKGQTNWLKIRSTRGISRLISNVSSGPSRLPAALIAELQSRCASNLPLGPKNDFKPGELVHVTDGPFATFLATVEKIDEQARIWLLIDFLGRSARISTSLDCVVPKK